jgi:hypothetical protein
VVDGGCVGAAAIVVGSGVLRAAFALAVAVLELELTALLLDVFSPSELLRVLGGAAVAVALVLLVCDSRPLTPATHTRSAAANIPASNRQPGNANQCSAIWTISMR